MCKSKTIAMSKETKAALSILIKEIRDCKNLDEVNQLIDTWVKANNLHPEKVRTFSSREEFNTYLESGKAPFRIK